MTKVSRLCKLPSASFSNHGCSSRAQIAPAERQESLQQQRHNSQRQFTPGAACAALMLVGARDTKRERGLLQCANDTMRYSRWRCGCERGDRCEIRVRKECKPTPPEQLRVSDEAGARNKGRWLCIGACKRRWNTTWAPFLRVGFYVSGAEWDFDAFVLPDAATTKESINSAQTFFHRIKFNIKILLFFSSDSFLPLGVA